MTKKILTKSDLAFIMAMMIYLLPVIILAIYGTTFSESYLKKAGIVALLACLFLIPFVFFKQRTAFLINGIFVILSPFEIIHILVFKNSLDSGIIMLALQTDYHEVLELMSSFWHYIIIFIIVIIFYFVLVLKYINNNYLFSIKEKIIYLSSLVFIVSSLYSYCLYLGFNFKNKDTSVLKVANNAFDLKFRFLYPYNLINSFTRGFEMRERVKISSIELENFRFESKSENDINKKEIYVLIIGESARYSNFSKNGYSRKTSPNLDTISNLVSFKNIFSEANNTEISLPILLTRATALNYELKNKEKSVVEAFSEAGFSTYWIANQSANNTLVNRIAQNCTEKFMTSKDFDTFENFDEKLLPIFSRILLKKEKKQFIILHTLGSHFRYNFRYPSSFRFFKPDLQGSVGYDLINEKSKIELINSYDNSIRYTDYFLSSIISKLNSQKCLSYMFYTSDHAENLFENGNILHGNTPNYYSLHVPLFVWYSNEYKCFNPIRIKSMKNNTHKKQSTSIVFHSLIDLASISTKYLNKRKSICSDSLGSDSLFHALSPNKELSHFKF